MGDVNRFRLFADLIGEQFPLCRQGPIADVASGHGGLQAALRAQGFTNITSWDKRRRNAGPRRCYHYGYFDYRSAPRGYDLVVAMHPDQATDHVISYAVKHRIPFAVCPCCRLPSAHPFDGDSQEAWLTHLTAIAQLTHDVERLDLSMSGRSVVLIGRPR